MAHLCHKSPLGYKSHISIDRCSGFIRGQAVTSVTAADGHQLKRVFDTDNTSAEVWGDTRSESNEKWLAKKMLVSRIHRKKPKGQPMPKASARANARKSAIRARVEHVFAHQKNRFGLFIRTLKRAEAKLTLANLAYNMDRLIFHERRATAVRPECGFRRKKRPANAICSEKSTVSKNHNWPQQGINRELIRVSSSLKFSPNCSLIFVLKSLITPSRASINAFE